MAAQPEYHETTTKASPPPYEASSPNGKNKQPGPAMGGQWYLADTQLATIKFIYCPNPSVGWWTQDWAAILFVKCSNVPRLMREGFYWDSANVVDEDGYINTNLVDRVFFRRDGKQWNGRRNYFLKDLQEPQRWTAMIEVFALRHETLCRFDLSQLSRERIHCVLALSQGGDHIYEYCHGKPQCCYNAIYNNMPMEGRWPWPRKNAEGNRQEKQGYEEEEYGKLEYEEHECEEQEYAELEYEEAEEAGKSYD
ncbi:hypothetical protein F4824DRAFT_486923 [Ustulina deusta]|nr:hypothetical protein F4824DRAFT_486923 [Ustulina deusta]